MDTVKASGLAHAALLRQLADMHATAEAAHKGVPVDQYVPSAAVLAFLAGAEAIERAADVEVACAQAVEFASYVEDAAKGKMVERARHFLSLPFAQDLTRRLRRRLRPVQRTPEMVTTGAVAIRGLVLDLYGAASDVHLERLVNIALDAVLPLTADGDFGDGQAVLEVGPAPARTAWGTEWTLRGPDGKVLARCDGYGSTEEARAGYALLATLMGWS